MTYIITNTHGVPLNTFHFGDMEYSEIFDFSRKCYCVYKTRKEAVERLEWVREVAEQQRERWGEELTNKVLNFTKTMFIRLLN